MTFGEQIEPQNLSVDTAAEPTEINSEAQKCLDDYSSAMSDRMDIANECNENITPRTVEAKASPEMSLSKTQAWYKRQGANPEYIKKIQNALGVNPSGEINFATIVAIKDYQASQGLQQIDGLVGPKTLASALFTTTPEEFYGHDAKNIASVTAKPSDLDQQDNPEDWLTNMTQSEWEERYTTYSTDAQEIVGEFVPDSSELRKNIRECIMEGFKRGDMGDSKPNRITMETLERTRNILHADPRVVEDVFMGLYKTDTFKNKEGFQSFSYDVSGPLETSIGIQAGEYYEPLLSISETLYKGSWDLYDSMYDNRGGGYSGDWNKLSGRFNPVGTGRSRKG